MEGWGENDTNFTVDEILPEGWWQRELEKERKDGGNNKSLISTKDINREKSNKFKFKLNKAEEKELTK